MDFHSIAGIDQETDHDRLRLLMTEKIEPLLLVLIEDVEIALREVGNKEPLIVRYGNWNDDLVYRDLDRPLRMDYTRGE